MMAASQSIRICTAEAFLGLSAAIELEKFRAAQFGFKAALVSKPIMILCVLASKGQMCPAGGGPAAQATDLAHCRLN